SQRRGGRGKVGMQTKEEDFVEKIFITSTHHYILIFTTTGRVYWLKVYQIPQAGRAARGKAIINLINLLPEERVASILPVREFSEEKSIVLVTKRGIIKKTSLAAYANPRSSGIIAMSVDDGDALIDVQMTNNQQDVFLGTKKGKAIRFHAGDVRDMGRTARGVTGIRMDDDDCVVGVEILSEGNAILTVSENGYGKRALVEEYPLHHRGGKGTINLKISAKTGLVSGVCQVTGEEDVVLISDSGKIIRLRVDEISLFHRAAQGVKLIGLSEEEHIVSMARTERDTNVETDAVENLEEEEEEDILADRGTPEE
ncbi:MAG: DNA gyrase subunit A, partial [Syntrophobacterales bacterium]|nr:DNA gyrase subunit A [Syntrophobacterales bacterium]